MLGLTCEADCPDLSWNFVETQLMFFAGLWGSLLIGGYSLTIYSITHDMDEFREKVDVLQGNVRCKKEYVTICACLAVFQCCMFCIRSFSKTVDGISFLLELVACCLYFFNFILMWLSKSLCSFGSFTAFMFSWAFIDCLLFPSVLCLTIVKVEGSLSWFSFSYLASFHILESWGWMLELRRVNLQVLSWQAIDVAVNMVVLVFYAAMMMMTLENLGDPSWLSSWNDTEWNTLSALYYVFVTISTVGYGDLAPVTGLGRVFAIVTIFSGISSVVLAMYKILQVLNMHSAGGGSYRQMLSYRHIIVTGNPSSNMVLDFIAEVFHPDHADDSEDLQLIFLLPRGTDTNRIIQNEMRQRKNVHIAPKVHVFLGSVLERHDLQRVAPMSATAFFVLPNANSKDYMHEDTEDIIRMMAILKVNPGVRLILLLMKAENQQLLNNAGAVTGTNVTCLAMDQFKHELLGKSCQVPGFATLICNLFKTIADNDNEDYSGLGPWLQEYDKGTGNEIYEVELSMTYAQRDAVFSEVVLDVIEQTDGAVYLIGLVENSARFGKRVIVNPGTWYPIKDAKTAGVQTSGIFIAADREAVQQCEGRGVFLGRRERPPEAELLRQSRMDRKRKEKRNAIKAKGDGTTEVASAYADPLEDLIRRDPKLTKEMQGSARKLIQLAKQQHKAAEPQRMPLKLLAQGGHILVLCIGVHEGEELRLGAEHLLKPLRGGDGKKVADIPLLIMSPVAPRDWHRVSEDSSVFYMRGSPLSLFDLERANFRHTSNVLIIHSGAPRSDLMESWMVDSDIVCCVRLIESELPSSSNLSVIAEIAVDTNHNFVPLTGVENPAAADGPRRPTSPAAAAAASRTASRILSRFGRSKAAKPISDEDDEGSEGKGGGGRAPAFGSKWGSAPAPQVTEYYRQARYACGQLFVGNVVTSLTVNTFFNPSLWELVHKMIEAEVVMVPLPRDWEGKSYYEYFDKLLREDQLMAVAIYRRAEAPGKDEDGPAASNKRNLSKKSSKKWSYVYTAPPAKETHMQRGDRIICFGNAFKSKDPAEEAEKAEEAMKMIENA